MSPAPHLVAALFLTLAVSPAYASCPPGSAEYGQTAGGFCCFGTVDGDTCDAAVCSLDPARTQGNPVCADLCSGGRSLYGLQVGGFCCDGTTDGDTCEGSVCALDPNRAQGNPTCTQEQTPLDSHYAVHVTREVGDLSSVWITRRTPGYGSSRYDCKSDFCANVTVTIPEQVTPGGRFTAIVTRERGSTAGVKLVRTTPGYGDGHHTCGKSGCGNELEPGQTVTFFFPDT